MSNFIWQPNSDFLTNSNVAKFMQAQNIATHIELIKKSTDDITWFWQSALQTMGMSWYQAYQHLYDDSNGLAFTQWFLGGKTNIVLNCIDRHIKNGFGNKIAFIWEGECGATQKITYQQLSDQVNVLAGALTQSGIQAGDRICLYMPMVPEMVYAFFAAQKIGAIIVPIFSGFGKDPLAVRLQHAQVKLVFTADGGLRRGKEIFIKDVLDEALAQCPSVQKVIVVKRLHRQELPWNHQRDIWYQDFIKVTATLATAELESEHPCMIIYTSGTTGKPKGCVHTHAGVLATVQKEHYFHFDLKPQDIFFWFTDIGWMMGPWEMIGVLSFGATFVIYEGAPDYPNPDRVWDIVTRHQVSILGISPTAVRVLKKAGDEWVKNYDFKNLRLLGSTGEAWDEESYLWFFENIGKRRCPIMNISGGTELMGCLLAPLPIAPLKLNTLQGPCLGMDVDVWDENGNSLPANEVGYLVCKKPAPSMTKAFWQDTERYLETYFEKWPNIWCHGDWAVQDEDGLWFLRGRADDTIKVAGRRTGPAEIEAAAMHHSIVAECAAIGIPHDIKGESIVIFVVLKNNQNTSAALAQQISEKVVEQIGKSLKPEKIHIVPALPKTRSGKIVRGLLKKKYLGKDLGDLSSVENPQSLDAIHV